MAIAETILTRALTCDHAFQPIISTSTLRTHGIEALARFPGGAEGQTILTLLDEASAHGMVLEVERVLVRKALTKFAASANVGTTELFCNVDNRVFSAHAPEFASLDKAIRASGLMPHRVCWEISERDAIDLNSPAASRFLANVARSDVRIALDDFGIGISNFERLLHIEPHYVKIDRCFIDGLAAHHRKQAIIAKVCELAHALGYLTVAEGVEREEDFRTARELGCDFAQGFLIARPTQAMADIRPVYGEIARTTGFTKISARLLELRSNFPPVRAGSLLADAAERFNANGDLVLLPVVDDDGQVKGALYERDVRQILMSVYGRELLVNRGAPTTVDEKMRRCPVADARAPLDVIINSYVVAEGAEGIVLLEEGRYAGYLSNQAVLRLAAERDIRQAREQNPLTQLPGNQAIERHLTALLASSTPVTIAVVDFDHFKAFNDRYGFLAGDRALQMFADALRVLKRDSDAFVAHIGGDDFFVSVPCEASEAYVVITEMCAKFAHDVTSLYSAEDRGAGGIFGLDRYGAERFFPLLRASAGLLVLPDRRDTYTRAALETRLASLKAEAKSAVGGVVVDHLADALPVPGDLSNGLLRLAS